MYDIGLLCQKELNILLGHCAYAVTCKWKLPFPYGPRQANLCLRAFRHDKF